MEAVKSGTMRAWLIGTGVLAAAFVGWMLLLKAEVFSTSMAFVLWLSPGIAGFVTSLLAPTHKFLLGASMAIPAALMAVALNSVFQLSGGAVDLPGIEGSLVLFTLVLLGSAVVSGLGAAIGRFLAHGRQ